MNKNLRDSIDHLVPQDSLEAMGKVGFVSNKGTKKAHFGQIFWIGQSLSYKKHIGIIRLGSS